MAKTPKILLIYTGGTIGMVKDFKTGALKTFNFLRSIKKVYKGIIKEIKIPNSNAQPISIVI